MRLKAARFALSRPIILSSGRSFGRRGSARPFFRAISKQPTLLTFLPKTQQELRVLLNDYLLSRTIHDVGYKLTHGSNEIDVPLRRLIQFVDGHLV